MAADARRRVAPLPILKRDTQRDTETTHNLAKSCCSLNKLRRMPLPHAGKIAGVIPQEARSVYSISQPLPFPTP